MLTRFAPSPTGYLHVGNMRTALICYLYAKKVGGEFLLRIDDTDTERSKEEYVDALQEDLAWMGIVPDRIERQSLRFDRYDEVVKDLKAKGRLYPCYETAEDLEVKRKMQLSRGLPPIYDRAALALSDGQKAAYEAEGRMPHWRFKLEDKDSVWDDEIRGKQKFSATHSSDPILIRGNGVYTYMLPSAVDDVDFGVTHVLRGEDHVSNTAIQIQIFEALGGELPTFAHNSLIKSAEGKLSKRKGSATIASLRNDGIDALALASFLAKIGTSDPVELGENMQQLIDGFDIAKFGRAPTTYSLKDVMRLNVKMLHQKSYADVKESLAVDVGENFWNVVRANIENINEVQQWWDMCEKPLTPVIDDVEFTAQAAGLLPEGEWNQDTWGQWTAAVKNETGRKGKELFMPIRKALTGLEHGPELKVLLPLIGRQRVLSRLQGEVA